jgi:hypothetical protein
VGTSAEGVQIIGGGDMSRLRDRNVLLVEDIIDTGQGVFVARCLLLRICYLMRVLCHLCTIPAEHVTVICCVVAAMLLLCIKYGASIDTRAGCTQTSFVKQTLVTTTDTAVFYRYRSRSLFAGNTMKALIPLLKKENPRSVKVASLLEKRTHRSSGFKAHYAGFSIPDK